MGDVRQFAPSAERNSGPIVEVLRAALPATGRALEIASGTGQHVVAFARAFPGLVWTPSDADAAARESIAAWTAHEALPNVEPPHAIDVTGEAWHAALAGPFDAILAINLVHIAPFAATTGLMRGAAALLPPGGLLYLYGAFRRDGAHTASSNEAFDGWLKRQNPSWGVRDIGEVTQAAASEGFRLAAAVPMPANNFSLLLRR